MQLLATILNPEQVKITLSNKGKTYCTFIYFPVSQLFWDTFQPASQAITVSSIDKALERADSIAQSLAGRA